MADGNQARGGSKIPKPFIDALLARVDLVGVVGEHVELRKAGAEYQGLCPFHSEKSPSFTVNPGKGFYHCFGCGAHGDAIDFLVEHLHYAFRDAVEHLAGRAGLSVPVEGAPYTPPPTTKPAGGAAGDKRKSVWRTIVPVPDTAPEPTFKHWHHGPATHYWPYYSPDGQQFYGYVCRFDKPNGGKEVLPLTWCVDESDDRGTCKWHWKQWDEPRPLYIPRVPIDAELPVLLVEGEKCAEAGLEICESFNVVSWPGGGKAWAKADWSLLAGKTVIAWADADVKREPLTRAEQEEGVDPASKPIWPLDKQPGYKAMAAILTELQANHGCTVLLCPLPDPATQAEPDGWDLADAIADGWTQEQAEAHIRSARPFVPADGAASSSVGRANPRAQTPAEAGAGERDVLRAWRSHLLTTDKGAVKPVRENIVLAMDGIPARGVEPAPGCGGVIGYNEFTNDVIKLKDAPWDSPVGTWAEVDELKMGEYLVREHWLPSCSRGTLEEAVRVIAFNHRFHPVRAYLEGLKWDGKERLATWVQRACLEEDEWDMRDPLQKYLARAGTWFLQGMCARVMQPGVKFDYMLILEGEQGMRKSSLFAALGGDYFADTGLVLGDKDSYQQLQGKWIYEFAELDSFGKAEVTKIKSFIASKNDYFRASFDRRARNYPRQVVFGGTTNEDTYLTDPTGNRRFWPVRITRQIDIEWVMEVRDQLFAEAMERFRANKRMYPTLEEERELFVPQQQQRQVENAIQSKAAWWLYDNAEGELVNEISVVELLGKLGIGIEKLGPGRYHEKQAAAALKHLGWEKFRSGGAGRSYLFRRPRQSGAQPDVNGAGGCPV